MKKNFFGKKFQNYLEKSNKITIFAASKREKVVQTPYLSNPFAFCPMRKIEEKMLVAVRNNRNFECGNTRITDGNVYLHGIKIAEVTPTTIKITDCGGWRSNTTKSRLNVLLLAFTDTCIIQRDFEWFYCSANGRMNFEPKTFDRV